MRKKHHLILAPVDYLLFRGPWLTPPSLPPASSSSFLLIPTFLHTLLLHSLPKLALPFLIANIESCTNSRSCRCPAPWESVPPVPASPPLPRGKTVDTLIIIVNAALTEDAGDLCAVPTNILSPHRLQAHLNSCGQDSSRGVALSRSNRF